MAKFSYSKSKVVDAYGTVETFSAQEFNSFDEAIKAVEKGWYDRDLELQAKKKIVSGLAGKAIEGAGVVTKAPASDTLNPPNDTGLKNNVGNNQL